MPSPGIEIRILEEDGLTYRADALVLKHAQALYGLDRKAVVHTGIDPDLLPKPGEYQQFPRHPNVAAGAMLFIGTRPIGEFTYSDVRDFGYRALACVANSLRDVTEIAVTLHGVGYGLDETECFDAEVAGILDAVRSGDVPHPLRIVSFLELNAGRAARMRRRLERLVGSDTPAGVGAAESIAQTSGEVLRQVGTATQRREHAFVAMPFDESFSDTFHYALTNAVHSNDLLCQRIDKDSFVGDILQRLKDQIRTAKIVIADVTGANPNVCLEIGYAWGHDVPTMLVCKKGSKKASKLNFDIRAQKCIFYGSIHELEQTLTHELREVLRTL